MPQQCIWSLLQTPAREMVAAPPCPDDGWKFSLFVLKYDQRHCCPVTSLSVTFVHGQKSCPPLLMASWRPSGWAAPTPRDLRMEGRAELRAPALDGGRRTPCGGMTPHRAPARCRGHISSIKETGFGRPAHLPPSQGHGQAQLSCTMPDARAGLGLCLTWWWRELLAGPPRCGVTQVLFVLWEVSVRTCGQGPRAWSAARMPCQTGWAPPIHSFCKQSWGHEQHKGQVWVVPAPMLNCASSSRPPREMQWGTGRAWKDAGKLSALGQTKHSTNSCKTKVRD